MTTPLHLLGLNFYNTPTSTVRERSEFLRAEAGKTIAARCVVMCVTLLRPSTLT